MPLAGFVGLLISQHVTAGGDFHPAPRTGVRWHGLGSLSRAPLLYEDDTVNVFVRSLFEIIYFGIAPVRVELRAKSS
jgi:hypothetical protein